MIEIPVEVFIVYMCVSILIGAWVGHREATKMVKNTLSITVSLSRLAHKVSRWLDDAPRHEYAISLPDDESRRYATQLRELAAGRVTSTPKRES